MSSKIASMRRSTLVLVTIAFTALATVGVAWASDAFSDVGAGNPFHDQIGWMADQGISEGFDDGTFRPSEPVTRQAMAAFMQRLAPKVAVDERIVGLRTYASSTGISVDTDRADVISFDKRSDGSMLRVTFRTHIRVDAADSSSFCQLRIAVNGPDTATGSGSPLYAQANGSDASAVVTSVEVFEGLQAGSYSIGTEMRYRADQCQINPQNFNELMTVEEIPYLAAP